MSERNVELLGAALGPLASGATLVDAAEWYRHPVRTLGAYHTVITSALDAGAPAVRIVGEPVWPDDRALVDEWSRYESVLNDALQGMPVWVRCPYDTRVLPDDVLARARATHPVVVAPDEAPGAFASSEALFSRLAAEPLDEPPTDARRRRYDRADLADVRAFVERTARACRMEADRVPDVVIAVSELATNAFVHGAPPVEITAWLDGERFRCDVLDAGGGFRRVLSGFLPPSPDGIGGWGVWIARNLCDLVEIRSAPGHTLARVTHALADPGEPHGSAHAR